MGMIEPHPVILGSEMFGAAATGPLAPGRCATGSVFLRVDGLMRLKASMPLLAPDRERNFWLAIDEARLAAVRGIESEVTAAIFALDFLSLELCDE